MKKYVYKILSAILITIFALLQCCNVMAAEHDIVILHTNDIHCNVDQKLGLARVAWLKKKLISDTPNVILIDAGDAIQGKPLGKMSNGEAIINIMNEVGYDFCIPGNHEFDYGMERFKELAKLQNAGYYSANIIEKNSASSLLPEFKIFECEGTKIAFIGVTTPETLRSSTPTYFQNNSGEYIYSFYEDKSGEKLYNKLQSTIDTVKSLGSDYIFIVAHLGSNGVPQKWSSIDLAKNITKIDGIIDGHSHEKVNRIITDKNGKEILLTQTGSELEYLGMIEIKPDGKIKSSLISSIDGEDARVNAIIAQEIKKYEPIFKQTIGEAAVKLYCTDPNSGERTVRKQECNLGNFVADSFKYVLDCDIAIVNGGGIREELEIGILNYNDLVKAFPFGNSCSVIEVTGQQILDALEVGVKNYPNEHGGFLQVSGLSYSFDPEIPSGVILNEKGNFLGVKGAYRVQEVYVGTEPLQLDGKYSLGSVDYILRNGGNSMTMFKDAYLLKDAVLNDYDAILEYLQNHLNGKIGEKYANPYGEGRIKVIRAN